jgi:hypothetical protein
MKHRILPIVCVWRTVDVHDSESGEVRQRRAMVPLERYDNLSARQYHEGEEYPLVPLEPRSRASHNAYFAELNEAFDNLPEGKRLVAIAEELGITTIPPGGFMNSEHFRAWALCQTGWCETMEFDFDEKADARMVASKFRKKDAYAQILVRGSHVTIKEAVSQSAAAMSKEPFEKSKHDVLDLLTSMVGVSRGELKKQAGRSA